jgi:hypothetical protein
MVWPSVKSPDRRIQNVPCCNVLRRLPTLFRVNPFVVLISFPNYNYTVTYVLAILKLILFKNNVLRNISWLKKKYFYKSNIP